VSNGDKTADTSEFLKFNGGCKREKVDFGLEGEQRNQPMSWDIVKTDDLPKNVDWRDVNGQNFVGWSKN